MFIYLVTQNVNDDYDTYDGFVVIAENEEQARITHPAYKNWDGKSDDYSSWCDVKDVKVELIGNALEGAEYGVVLYSFNAG
jgi:hypothetical protein